MFVEKRSSRPILFLLTTVAALGSATQAAAQHTDPAKSKFSAHGYGGFINKALNSGTARSWITVNEFRWQPLRGAVIHIAPRTNTLFTGDRKTRFDIYEAYLRLGSSEKNGVTLGRFATPFNLWLEYNAPLYSNDASFSQPFESALAPFQTNGGRLDLTLGPAEKFNLRATAFVGFESDRPDLFSGTRTIWGLRLAARSAKQTSVAGVSLAVDDFLRNGNRIAGGFYQQKLGRLSMTHEIGYSDEIGWGAWSTLPLRIAARSHLILKYEFIARTASRRNANESPYPYKPNVPDENSRDLYFGFRHWFGDNIRVSALYKFGLQGVPQGLVSGLVVRW